VGEREVAGGQDADAGVVSHATNLVEHPGPVLVAELMASAFVSLWETTFF
jgi:hypothetical protein